MISLGVTLLSTAQEWQEVGHQWIQATHYEEPFCSAGRCDAGPVPFQLDRAACVLTWRGALGSDSAAHLCVCACLGWQWSLVDNVLLEVIKPPRLDHDFVGQENIDLTDSMSFPF